MEIKENEKLLRLFKCKLIRFGRGKYRLLPGLALFGHEIGVGPGKALCPDLSWVQFMNLMNLFGSQIYTICPSAAF